jgi:hypothetical protein
MSIFASFDDFLQIFVKFFTNLKKSF